MVTLSQPLSRPVTFQYATSNDTARAGKDYEATSGTSLIGPGAIRQKIAVTVYGVSRKHPETGTAQVYFTMTISDAMGAKIDRSHARATILEIPSVSISDSSVVQALRRPPLGETPIDAYFSISISPTLSHPVTVDYKTADGTAIHGIDYKPTSGTVTIPANRVSVRVPVLIKAADQNKYVYSYAKTTFYVDISTPDPNVYITRSRGKGTIKEQKPEGPLFAMRVTRDLGEPSSGSIATPPDAVLAADMLVGGATYAPDIPGRREERTTALGV